MILGHYMQHDRVSLLKAVKTWPQGIYDAGAIVLALKGSLEASPTDRLLLEAAVELCVSYRLCEPLATEKLTRQEQVHENQAAGQSTALLTPAEETGRV